MKNFSEQDKEKIANAVKEAEKTTSGEIVPMYLKQSDNYPAAYFRSALIFAFMFTLIYYFAQYDNLDILYVFIVEVAGLIFGFIASSACPFIKRLFSLKDELAEEVHQRAMQAFLENNLHTTRDRTGILIMVSQMERRVEILADVGINEKVSENTWNDILNKLIQKIKDKDIVNGLCEAITECGRILTEHFPIKDDDTNELGNELVME